jgi:tetratricopeptide (TPR) repeat protein
MAHRAIGVSPAIVPEKPSPILRFHFHFLKNGSITASSRKLSGFSKAFGIGYPGAFFRRLICWQPLLKTPTPGKTSAWTHFLFFILRVDFFREQRKSVMRNIMQNETEVREYIGTLEMQSLRDPTDSTARYNLGVAFSSLGLAEKAITAYRSAIHIKPGYVAAHYNLGCILLESGLPQEAKTEFEQVTRLAPKMTAGFFMLGTTYGALGLPKQLIEATRRGLEIEPDSSQACFNIGLAYNRLGEFRDAIEFLSRTVTLDSQNATAYLELGKAYRGLGKIREEVQAYRDALDVRGDFLDAWFHLGAAYLKVRRGDQAEVAYPETQGTFNLHDPEQLFYFALGLLAFGRKEQAKKHLPGLQAMAPPLACELQGYIDEEK